MKLDVTQRILDLDDEPIFIDRETLFHDDGKVRIKDGKVETTGGKEMTLGRAFIDALMAGHEDEKGLSGEKRLDRFELACAIKQAQKDHLPLEFSRDQVKNLKELMCKAYLGPLIYARVVKLMEAAEKLQEASKPNGRSEKNDDQPSP